MEIPADRLALGPLPSGRFQGPRGRPVPRLPGGARAGSRTSPAAVAALLLALLGAGLSTGCGIGTLAAGAAGSGGGGGGGLPAGLSGLTITSTQTSPARLRFVLTNAESQPATVELRQRFLDQNGQSVDQPLSGLAQNPLGLTSAPTGVEHQFDWDFSAEPWAEADGALVQDILVWARVLGSQEQPVTGLNALEVDLGNDAPEVLSANLPSSGSGLVAVTFVLADSSSDLLDVRIDYDLLNDTPDAGFQAVTPQFGAASAEFTFTDLSSSPSGISHGLVWNTGVDLAGQQGPVTLRLTAFDGAANSAALLSATGVVDNNLPPQAVVDGGAFLASPDQRRGLALPFELRDPEGDLVTAVVQWRTPGGSFPVLPDSLEELEELQKDPTSAAALQLATPIGRSASGPAERLTSDRLRLVDCTARAPFALANGLIGQELELLVGSQFPAIVSAAWAANQPVAPVGIVPASDGLSAYLLETNGPGWSLLRRELASGASSAIASGSGAPGALALEPTTGRLLVASDAAGEWRIERVEPSSGNLSLLYTRAGTLPLGSVFGLAAVNTSQALLTVADQLIQVQYPAGESAAAATLLSGLAEPRGIAVDPRRPDWALLCERSGDQGGQPLGRIAWVDLARRQRFPLAALDAQGARLTSPGAVALDPATRRLYVHAAGVLQELPLGHFGAGRATPLGDFAGDVRSIAAGADGLLLLALTSANGVARGGGLRERQEILDFDADQEAAQLAGPSLHQPGDRWRLVERGFPRRLATPSGVRGSFAWDSRDLPAGEAALLRLVPYDQDAGQLSQSSAGKTPLSALEVEPETYLAGLAAVPQQARGLACADLDGDGDADLVGVFTGLSNPVVVLTQQEPGRLTPRFAFASSSEDPLDVRLADWDGDGDLDVAVANGGSQDLAIWWQSGNLDFTALAPLRLGASSSTPGVLGLENADMDGDGRQDLILAFNGGSAFFRNLGAGSFAAALDLAGGSAPARTLDTNRDGDLDVLLGNPSTGSGLRQQPQTAPGVFAASPSSLTAAVGPVVRRMQVGDLNGNGLLELYTHDGLTRLLGFEQTTSSNFGASAGEVLLNGIAANLSAGALASGDVDGDGRPDLLVAARGTRRLLSFPSAGPASAGNLPPGLAKAPLLVGPGESFTSSVQASSGLCLADLDGDGNLECLLGAGGAVDRYAPVGAGRFVAPISYGSLLPSTAPRSALARDLDKDGAFDWLLTNNSGAPRLLRQRAPTLFEPETLPASAPAVSALQVGAGDFNGDGLCDVVSADNGSLALYLQASNGNFPAEAATVYSDARFDFRNDAGLGLITLDWNRDGLLDLIGVSSSRHSLLLIPNSPSGLDPTGLQELTLATNATPRQVLCRDLDGDGLLDLAVADLTGDQISILRGTAIGSFEATPSTNLPADFAYLLESGDLTGDGRPDLVTNSQSAANLWLLRALPGGGFAAGEALPLPPTGPTTFTRSIALGDLDGDGRTDLAAKLDGAVARLLQVAPGRFQSAGPLLQSGTNTNGNTSEGLHLLDLDGDGDPDLGAPGLSGQSLAIFYASH